MAAIVIPARGGSKGIPRKNLRLLAGRPLLDYAVKAALAARCAKTVAVSTDDRDIAAHAESLGALVLMRDLELAADSATLDPVILDAARRIGDSHDIILSVQATCPFVTPSLIDKVCHSVEPGRISTAFTVTDDTHLCWTEEGGRLAPAYTARVNRQQLPRRLKETGAVVAVERKRYLETGTRFCGPFAPVEISGPSALDIDDHQQWGYAEAVLTSRDIILVASDVQEAHWMLKLAEGLARHRVCLRAEGEASQLAMRNNYPLAQAGLGADQVLAGFGLDDQRELNFCCQGKQSPHREAERLEAWLTRRPRDPWSLS